MTCANCANSQQFDESLYCYIEKYQVMPDHRCPFFKAK